MNTIFLFTPEWRKFYHFFNPDRGIYIHDFLHDKFSRLVKHSGCDSCFWRNRSRCFLDARATNGGPGETG